MLCVFQKSLYLLLNSIPLYEHNIVFFILSPVDGYVDCFPVFGYKYSCVGLFVDICFNFLSTSE